MGIGEAQQNASLEPKKNETEEGSGESLGVRKDWEGRERLSTLSLQYCEGVVSPLSAPPLPPLSHKDIPLFPAVVGGQGKRGEHKTSPADKKVRVTERVRRDQHGKVWSLTRPTAQVSRSHRQHGMLPSASDIHTSQVHDYCITTVMCKESASIVKTKHRGAQVSAEHSSGRGPDSSLQLAVCLHLGASLATRDQNQNHNMPF